MRKRFAALAILLVLVIGTAAPALAAPPSRSYTYDAYGLAVPSPTPYMYETEIDGANYEDVGAFKNPEDVFIDSECYIYILDTGNNRIVVFNENKDLVRIIDNIRYKSEAVVLNGAEGLYVYEYYGKKYLYIADKGNARIIRLDMKDELSGEDITGRIEADKIYNKPVFEALDKDTKYQPSKLIVDRAERMFVLCTSINRGIVKLKSDGSFDSFFGAPDVTYTAIEAFWRMISSKKQLSQMINFVPTEYSNIAVDSRGFIYTTITAMERYKIIQSFDTLPNDVAGRQQYAPVRKLAADGSDILSRTGIFPPVGDVAVYFMSDITGSYNASIETLAGVSAFRDVTINDYDVYSVLDSRRMKVFTYDTDGNLLFVFGNNSTQRGTFTQPKAISYFKDDQICVLDGYTETSSLAFYKPTDYGATILSAVKYYKNGEYEKSEQEWVNVLKMNSNMTQAYTGVGKSLLRAGNYKEAMASFKISINTEYYSKALEQYLNETVGDKFTYIFFVIIGVFIIYTVYKWVRRFRKFLREGVKKVV